MREQRWNCMNSWNLTFRNHTGNFITVKPEYCGQSIVAFNLFSQPNLWVQISSIEKSDASSLLCLVRFVSSQSAKRQIGTRDNVGPLIELWFCFWKLKSFVTIERFDMNLNTSFWRNWASKKTTQNTTKCTLRRATKFIFSKILRQVFLFTSFCRNLQVGEIYT